MYVYSVENMHHIYTAMEDEQITATIKAALLTVQSFPSIMQNCPWSKRSLPSGGYNIRFFLYINERRQMKCHLQFSNLASLGNYCLCIIGQQEAHLLDHSTELLGAFNYIYFYFVSTHFKLFRYKTNYFDICSIGGFRHSSLPHLYKWFLHPSSVSQINFQSTFVWTLARI